MPPLHCPANDVAVVLIDVQPTFMAAIHENERVVKRACFLLEMAKMLEIPVLATEQNASRMGGLDPRIVAALPSTTRHIGKMSFSCWGEPKFRVAVESLRKSHLVLLGIETHICVSLTALDLLESGFEVFVCPDAVSARTNEMHKLGMERMRDAGVMPSHTESLAYEWMGSAEHPKFKAALTLVKESAM